MRITSSTITPNLRTVNVILIILITFVRVFLTNPDKKRYRKCREMNIPIGRNKKKPAGKRRVETVNLTTTNNYVRSL